MLLPRVLTPPLAHRLGISRSRCRTEPRHGRWRSLGRGVVLTVLGGPYELAPTVPVSRALADYALDASRDDTLALVARAAQSDRFRLEDIYAEYATGPRKHSAGLRRALSDVLDGARSVAEARAARRLAAAPVPLFELNVPVIDQRGRLRYVLDVLWRAQRAGLEIDSREHHSSEHDWQRTMIRHNELTRAGLALLHYPPALIMAKDSAFTRDVAQWLVTRSSETGVALASGRGVIRPTVAGGPEPLMVRFT